MGPPIENLLISYSRKIICGKSDKQDSRQTGGFYGWNDLSP